MFFASDKLEVSRAIKNKDVQEKIDLLFVRAKSRNAHLKSNSKKQLLDSLRTKLALQISQLYFSNLNQNWQLKSIDFFKKK